MTTIVYKGLQQGSFSFFTFYKARARRIIPALTLVCAVLVVFGYLFVIPKDYSILSEHITSSLLFYSNFTYFLESGYFDAASHEKWLLHTWSLSVEWQFYIVFPIVTAVLFKIFGEKLSKLVIAVLVVIGFTLATWSSIKWPTASFFLVHTRAWEMLAGGLAFFWPISKVGTVSRVIPIIGWTVIFTSFGLSDSEMAWPGPYTLLPVLGTLLVILCSQSNSRVYSNILVRNIGEKSYSLYLWHWPLIVGFAYLQTPLSLMLYIPLLLAISWGAFYLVENRRLSLTVTVTMMLVVIMLSFYITNKNGMESRIPAEYALTEKDYHARYYGGYGFTVNEPIIIGIKDKLPDAIFVGDSFALQYASALEKAALDKELSFAGLFDHGCLIVRDYTRYIRGAEDKVCSAEYEKLLAMTDGNTSPIVLGYAWNVYSQAMGTKQPSGRVDLSDPDKFKAMLFDQLEKLISDIGRRNYYLVLSPEPSETYAFRCLASESLLGYRFVSNCTDREPRKIIDVNQWLKDFAENHQNVTVIDPNATLCNTETCQVIIDRKPVHSDRSHLSVYGAIPVVDEILRVIGLQ